MPVGYHRNVSTASPEDPLGRIGPAGHSGSSPTAKSLPLPRSPASPILAVR